MNERTLFWLLVVVQAIGCQIILWAGLPVYHRLLAGGSQGATDGQLAAVLLAVAMMQSAHWTAMRLKPRLRFRRNVVLGHFVVFIGELSLFFINALAVVVIFDRFDELKFNFWKMLLLAGMLFAVCSYKYHVGSLGERLIEGDPGEDEWRRERPAA